MRTTSFLFAVLFAGCGASQPSEPAEPDHAAGHPGAHAGHHGGGHHGGEHHGHGQHGHHDFSDVERFAAIFDDPARDEWQRPTEVVELLDLEAGAVIADIGAGTGYFVPHLAAAVGADGRVVALDVEPAMVEHMRQRFEAAGLHNAEARTVATDSPGLEPESVDRVLIVDTWHHIGAREAYSRELRSALRAGGFVLVIDFTADSPHGPPAAMRLEAERVAEELEAGGLSVQILEEGLPYQYAVLARRDPSS